MQHHILEEQNPNYFFSENFIDCHCCICFVGCSFGLPVSCSLVSLLRMGKTKAVPYRPGVAQRVPGS